MSPGNGTALRPSGAHEIDDLASVFLFLGQVAERDVGTFARKGDGHGATDARIPASNQGFRRDPAMVACGLQGPGVAAAVP